MNRFVISVVLAIVVAGCATPHRASNDLPAQWSVEPLQGVFGDGGGAVLTRFMLERDSEVEVRLTTPSNNGPGDEAAVRLAIFDDGSTPRGLVAADSNARSHEFVVNGNLKTGENWILVASSSSGPFTLEATDDAGERVLQNHTLVTAVWNTTAPRPTLALPFETLEGQPEHRFPGVEVFLLVQQFTAGAGTWCPDTAFTFSGGKTVESQCQVPGNSIGGLTAPLAGDGPQAPSYFAAFPEAVSLCEPAGNASFQVRSTNVDTQLLPFYFAARLPGNGAAAIGHVCS